MKITLRQTATPNTVLQSFQYGYNKVGNRTWVKYASGSGDVYKYDVTYQLTGVKYGVGNPEDGYDLATGESRAVTYTYDALGSRTVVLDNLTTTNYSVNNLNQYTQIDLNSYTYDTNGNLTGDGTWTFGYDRDGHLITASKSGTSVSYKYDALGRRIEKSVNGTVTKFVYSGQNLIEERDASNNVTAKYVYAVGIDNPVEVIKSTGAYFFQQDALDNVTALTNSSGAIVESYTYDAFGKPVIKDGSGNVITTPATPFLFTGREYDAESGLYHYRTRAYSQNLGRFLQMDSIGFKGKDWNLYRYAANNPTNRVDPLGLENKCTDCDGKPKQGTMVAMSCCSSAAPEHNDGGNPYPPDYTYGGINASKMFSNTASNDWSNTARGCLSCMYKHGSDPTIAHIYCYANASARRPLDSASGMGDAFGTAAAIKLGAY